MYESTRRGDLLTSGLVVPDLATYRRRCQWAGDILFYYSCIYTHYAYILFPWSLLSIYCYFIPNRKIGKTYRVYHHELMQFSQNTYRLITYYGTYIHLWQLGWSIYINILTYLSLRRARLQPAPETTSCTLS